jgi:hypothetical protein
MRTNQITLELVLNLCNRNQRRLVHAEPVQGELAALAIGSGETREVAAATIPA